MSKDNASKGGVNALGLVEQEKFDVSAQRGEVSEATQRPQAKDHTMSTDRGSFVFQNTRKM